MKRILGPLVAISLVFSLAAVGVTAEIQGPQGVVGHREEVVYVNLEASGKVKDVFVVNVLDVTTPGVIIDHGQFSEIKNLTTTAPITHDTGHIAVEAPVGRFYYQGTLSQTVLPWDISISYYLNGKSEVPTALAGRDGNLEIIINTKPNASHTSFNENYLLQISFTLDTDRFTSIDAKGGTIANAGRNKIVTYTVMPNRPGHLSLQAQVKSLSLAPIEIAAVPLSIELDMPDTETMTGDLAALSKAIASLNDGTSQLKEGAQELAQGAVSLAAGSGSFGQGLGTLSDSSQNLVVGSATIAQALSSMSSALTGLPGQISLGALSGLPGGLAQLSNALVDVSGGLSRLQTGFAAAYTALDSAISTVPESNISQEEILGLYLANPGKVPLLDKLVEQYTAAQTIKQTYQATKAGFDAVGPTLATITTAVDTIAEQLASLAQELGHALGSNESAAMIEQLAQGISTLADDYSTFHAGVATYTAGVSELAASYQPLHGGITGLGSGASALHDAIRQINKGTNELSEGVKDLPQQVELEIDKLVGQYDKSGFVPVSFVSAQNTGTTAVQFVMRTEQIKTHVLSPTPPTDKPQLSIWQRFINLFRR